MPFSTLEQETVADVGKWFSKEATKMTMVSAPVQILLLLPCECATGVNTEPFSKKRCKVCELAFTQGERAAFSF